MKVSSWMMNNLINILWLAKSEYPTGSSLQPHHHEYYQIYYVISGEGDFIAGDQTITLGKGMYLFAKPNDVHGVSDTRDIDGEPLQMLEVKYVVFDKEFQERLNQIPIVCRGSDMLEEMLNTVFKEGIDTLPWYLEIATHTFISTLYYMIRFQKIDIAANPRKSKVVEQIKDKIKDNYKGEISLDQLASHVGHSKNYLCKVFKEHTGMTINLYLNKVKIDRAAELLVNTNFDISEISEQVGYNNIYHFIKTFNKMVGTSPGNYRKNELSGKALVSTNVRAIATIPIQRTRNDV